MKALFLSISAALVVLSGLTCTTSAMTLYDDFNQTSLDLSTWSVPPGGFTVPPLSDSKVQMTHPNGVQGPAVVPGDTMHFVIGDPSSGVGSFGAPHIGIRNDQGNPYYQLVVWNPNGSIYRGPDVGPVRPGDVFKIAWGTDDSVAAYKNNVLVGYDDTVSVPTGQHLLFSPGGNGFLSLDAVALNNEPVHPTNPVLQMTDFEILDAGENTPFVFNGQPYMALNYRPLDPAQQNTSYLYIRDLSDGSEVSRFGTGFSFVSAFVDGGQLNVFGTENTNDNWTEDVHRFWTTDMVTWQQEEVVTRIGSEHLFNTSVCRGPQDYVMAYESNLPVQWSFRFARSDDLSNWEEAGLQFADLIGASACANPAIRYCDGFYYMIYGTHRYKGPSRFYEFQRAETMYVTLIARSRDLVTWELSPTQSPMIEPVVGEGINATDADLYEFEGKTYLSYMTGNQSAWADVHMRMYDGTMEEMLEAYFPVGAPTMKYDASTGKYNYLFTDSLPGLPGDANNDGNVDVTDLGVLATHYGTTSGAEWGDGDFNDDGNVDVSDLGILATNYGTVAAQAVPEPSTISLLLFGMLAFIRRRRRQPV